VRPEKRRQENNMKRCICCASLRIFDEYSIGGLTSEVGFLMKKYFSRLEFKDEDRKYYYMHFCKKHPFEKVIKKIMYKKNYNNYINYLSKKYAFDKNKKMGADWEGF
jgi:hypothetical protein